MREPVAGLRVSEFVTKPVSSRDLLARIRAQLHQRRLTTDLEAILRRPD